MVNAASLITVAALAFGATASPFPKSSSDSTSICADTIIAIDAKTASCKDAEFPEECHDAKIAARSLSDSFVKYGIKSKGEQAALISLMLYESGSFVYNKNHFPGRPGQGTKNMQMAEFNLEYAKSLFSAETVKQAESQGPESVLELVWGPNETFGSAAWYLTNKCDSSIRDGLKKGTKEGWTAYIEDCVETEVDDDRVATWEKALKVLKSS